MCGIIGYIGSKKASSVMLDSLRKLEYRGYDSVGMAVFDKELRARKGIGRVDLVNDRLDFQELKGNVGIAHTRWATHGGVTEDNSHPHFDCTGKVVIVHNGIIENFLELKDQLKRLGHEFKSETDSEVVAHLIEKYLDLGNTFYDSVIKSVGELKGSFALLALYAGEPDKIIAVRKDSPLVIGVGEGENFIASDVPAFLKHSRKAVFLKNHDVAVITKDAISIYNLETCREEVKQIQCIDWNVEQAEKTGFPHFMLKEIFEQPTTLRQALNQNMQKLNNTLREIKQARRVYFIAAGTSYHASMIGKQLLARKGIGSECVIASEYKNIINMVDDDTVIVAISQSGETADLIEAVRESKKNGAKVFSIINGPGSTLTRISDDTIYIYAGPEIGVASTKAFTGQLAVLYLMAMPELKDELITLSNKLEEMLEKEGLIRRIAEKIRNANDVYFLGKGLNYPTALEAALKLKEISYIHAEGMPAGELKHGTLALIEKGVPVMVFAPKNEFFHETISGAQEVKARGGYLIGFGDEKHEVFDEFLKVPKTLPELYPLIFTIIFQLLSYYTSILRGNNPDFPRNLAKSVTVK